MTSITTLLPHQVLVFGSNETGFHGAGLAGLACRGDARNTWREDLWFRRALSSPEGSPYRVGRWAVVGVAQGFQRGTEGMSYGIVTITRPGAKRSISLAEIAHQLDELCRFCDDHPEYEVLMTSVGAGLAGYTNAEMGDVFAHTMYAYARGKGLGSPAVPKPPNLVVPDDLYRP